MNHNERDEKERRVRLSGERRRRLEGCFFLNLGTGSLFERCSRTNLGGALFNYSAKGNVPLLSRVLFNQLFVRPCRITESRLHTHVKDCGKLPGERTIFAQAACRPRRLIAFLPATEVAKFPPGEAVETNRVTFLNLDRGL